MPHMHRRLLVLLAIGAVLVTVWFGLKESQPPNEPALTRGRLVISPSAVDFGDIDQGGGVVSAPVEVRNGGDATLEINRVSTSCGCTTARMDQSPLLPGETRTLTIEFDPMVHPDQSGPITRAVYIQSSDPANPEVEIDVIGNVISVARL